MKVTTLPRRDIPQAITEPCPICKAPAAGTSVVRYTSPDCCRWCGLTTGPKLPYLNKRHLNR